MSHEEHLLEDAHRVTQLATNLLLEARDLHRQALELCALAIGQRADDRVGQLERGRRVDPSRSMRSTICSVSVNPGSAASSGVGGPCVVTR